MADRLSTDSIRQIYDGGIKCFSWEISKPLEQGLDISCIDFSHVLERRDAKSYIQTLSPFLVYKSIVEYGLEESAEILVLLSQEQLTRLFDYALWTDDQLDHRKLMKWLSVFQQLEPKILFERFKGLEEEYQLAFLDKHIRVYTQESFERLSDIHQDRLIQLPSRDYYYQILSDDQELADFIQKLIEVILSQDLRYAYNLLAHASYQVPCEQEHQLKQFRQARMEEEGFLSYEESLQIFCPIDQLRLKNIWAKRFNHSLSNQKILAIPILEKQITSLFIDQVLCSHQLSEIFTVSKEALSQQLLYIINGIIPVTHIDIANRKEMLGLVDQIRSLISLGLEYLADNDLAKGAYILSKESLKKLFQVGLSLVYRIQENLIKAMRYYRLPGQKYFVLYFYQQKRGALLYAFDQYCLEFMNFSNTEWLKAIFNRFPMHCPNLFVLNTDKKQRDELKFYKVQNLISLDLAWQESFTIIGHWFLAKKSCEHLKELFTKTEIDRLIQTALVRWVLCGHFRYELLSPSDLHQFYQLSLEVLEHRLKEWMNKIKGELVQKILHISNFEPTKGEQGLLRCLQIISDNILLLRKTELNGKFEQQSCLDLQLPLEQSE